MKNKPIIKIKNTVGYNLLRIVFSLYVIIAIMITALHMYSEYNNEKSNILQEMQNTENMVKKQLTVSAWYLNTPLITEILEGILSSKSILGLSFESSNNLISGNFGIVDISKKDIENILNKAKDEVVFQKGLYSYEFDLSDFAYEGGRSLGKVTLYSNSEVVYDRIENNFLFIIINSIIKTFALWIIFLFFANKYLTKPFFEIIYVTNSVDYDHLEKANFPHKEEDKNEFDILKNTFNHMFEKLHTSNKKYIELNQNLEDKVKLRTNELEKSLNNLKEAQDKLVYSQKMASLGELIAGVSNELNTPVGVGLTSISHLQFLTENIQEQYDSKKLNEKEIEEYLKNAKNLTDTVNKNVDRISHIIKHFKEVAVDQASELKRVFNIKDYVNGLLVGLNTVIKKKDIKVFVNCDENIEIDSYPGFYSQIMTKLIYNSMNHGFKDTDKGNITIDIAKESNNLIIKYQDDGQGISKENLEHIFDPFFTTNKDAGGIGLGLHIIFNIITSNLKGTISCHSIKGEKTIFDIKIPL